MLNQNQINNIVKKALDIVKKDGSELPSDGVLTGQAISTLLLEEINWKKYRKKPDKITINDIDVFQERKINREVANPDGFAKEGNDIAIKYNKYDYINNTNIINRYKILSSIKTEKINITTFEYKKEYYDIRGNENTQIGRYKKVLETFDLNNVQVGIDLEKKELIYTQKFEEFIKTGELKVADFETPLHSSIRLVEKQQEHGLYCNIERELSKLSIKYGLPEYSKWVFREEMANKYNKYSYILNKYFDIKEVDISDKLEEGEVQKFRLWTLNKTMVFKESIQHYIDDIEKMSYICKTTTPVLENILEMLFYAKDNIKQNFIKMSEDLNILMLKTFPYQVEDKTKEINEYKYNFEEFKNWDNRETILMLNIMFSRMYKSDIHMKNIKTIFRTIKDHRNMIYVYYHFKNFKDLYRVDRLLKKLSNKYKREMGKDYVIGVIESYEQDVIQEGSIEIQDMTDVEIENMIESKYQYTITANVEKKFDDINDREWNISNINTGKGLVKEGNELEHCVGGYAEKLYNNDNMIISIKNSIHNELNCTLEIEKNDSDNNEWYVRQIYFKKNIKVYANLKRYIYLKLKEEVNITINDYNENMLNQDYNDDDIKNDKMYINQFNKDIRIKQPKKSKKEIIINNEDIPF